MNAMRTEGTRRKPIAMKSIIPTLIIALLLAGQARAAHNLTLRSDALPGNPIELLPGDISGPILIDLIHEAIPNGDLLSIAGWQVKLGIVPDPGTSGMLMFNTFGEPESNYLCRNIDHFGITDTINTGTELLTLDLNAPFSGGGEPGADISRRQSPAVRCEGLERCARPLRHLRPQWPGRHGMDGREPTDLEEMHDFVNVPTAQARSGSPTCWSSPSPPARHSA